MKRALIIGVGGFVGDYLAERLLLDGFDVSATKLPDEKYTRKNVTVFNLDILNADEFSDVLSTAYPDVIFHLAAQSSVALSWKNPQLTIDINIKGTVNLLEAVKCSGLSPRIILVGSGEEYNLANIYAITKATQNMLGSLYVKSYNMDIIMVRAYNHIGSRQTEQFVVSGFCKQVAEIEAGLKEPCIYVGNLSAKRDFTDVRDVVNAYSLISQHGKSGETYDIGSGKAVEIREILDFILELSDADIQVITDEKKLRPIDIPVIEADITKIRSLGWQPTIELRQSLTDILEYWRKTCR
jgi:GDP-4-dehydro-6-deoxy-D-mannose reductase